MSESIWIKLIPARIDLNEALGFCYNDSCGAVNSFIGTVRNATKGEAVKNLLFEAYEPMAYKELKKLATEAQRKWPIEKVCIVHRLGEVPVGEEAVVIVVASPHRKESFKACEFLIDQLKVTVPIWKKERLESGEVWVSAHP